LANKPLKFDVVEGSNATPLATAENDRASDSIVPFSLQFDAKGSKMVQYRIFKPSGYTAKLTTIEVSREGN